MSDQQAETNRKNRLRVAIVQAETDDPQALRDLLDAALDQVFSAPQPRMADAKQAPQPED